jgi:exopolysaccharide production protein ExoQ
VPSSIATLIGIAAILVLCLLDRDRTAELSPARWIPFAWVSLAGSRMVSEWLQIASAVTAPDQYLDGSPLDRLVLTLLLAAGVAVLLARGRRVGTLLRANGPILLFFSYCAISILWSDYPDVALKRWTKALGDIVMILVVVSDQDPIASVKWLLARVGFLLIPLSVLFVKYRPDLGRGLTPWSWGQYYTGVTTTKNGLGYVCLVFGLGHLWRVLEGLASGERLPTRGALIAHLSVLAMTLWLLWVANSATSLGCFLVGAGLIAVTRLPRFARRPAVVHVLVAAIVLVVVSDVFFIDGSGLVQAMGRDPTLTGRTELWGRVLQLRVDPLFGAGFDSFWLGTRLDTLWSVYWWHPNQAHNGYLEVFLNLGWIGLILLGYLIARGYRNVVDAVRREPQLGRLRLAFFVAALLYNLTEAAFKVLHPVWIAFLLSIIAVPDAPGEEER